MPNVLFGAHYAIERRWPATNSDVNIPSDPAWSISPALRVVEADGGQHWGSGLDTRRDAFLVEKGFQVLRFWNNDILQNLEGVCDMILRQLSDKQR